MKCPKIGIIGDGQLARMLVIAASDMGLKPWILGRSNSPAGLVCGRVTTDEKLFLSNVDKVLFESEFIEIEPLKNWPVTFFPALSVIEILQNKFSQKKLLKNLKIPTAAFLSEEYDESSALDAWCKVVEKKFPERVVLKYSRLGYDGKGVFVGQIFSQEARDFLTVAKQRKISVYAEACVNFSIELAMTAVVTHGNEIVFYPLVVSEQKNGICQFVYGPATAFGIDQKIEYAAQSFCKKISREVGMSGVFAVEFFVDKGEILVNEIAPRVHNSAHFTINACPASQFDNHIRSAAGLPLGSTKSHEKFAMINLIGEKIEKYSRPKIDVDSNEFMHWYDKDEERPGRKMGHVNVVPFDEKKLVLTKEKKFL